MKRKNVHSGGKLPSVTETGVIRKRWHDRLRVALVYPNRYDIGMANLGFQTVYRLFNAADHVVCERAFLPVNHPKKTFPVVSVETERPLRDFDIVAFSVSFENDYIHILTILDRAGLPLLAEDRGSPFPLIAAGGVACFLNPEPIADFIDCFLIGEGEALIPDFLDGYHPEEDRELCLKKLTRHVSGVYVPKYYTPQYNSQSVLTGFYPEKDAPAAIKSRTAKDLSTQPASSQILTPDIPFGETFLTEVARGCPHGCRFCTAGFVYRPVRFRPLPLLENEVNRASKAAKSVGLVGTAVSDLPHLAALCDMALDRKLRVSFSSLRTDAIDASLAKMLKKSGVKTATIAPDAGSERMRRVINKGITEDQIYRAVDHLVSAGIPNLKLYFMVGLPTETPEDIDAIVGLCKNIRQRFLEASRPKKRIGEISISLNSFVPKPFTPFQWAAMDTVSVLKAKIRTIQTGLKRVANLRVKSSPVRRDIVQALLSRGDRNVSRLLLQTYQSGGNWPATLKEHAKTVERHVFRMRPEDELLPWDFIDHGIRKSFLVREYHRAVRARQTPPCPPAGCTACGVCKPGDAKNSNG